MALHPADHQPASRETLYAILGSIVVSLVLACILVGNPFRALVAGYMDYSHVDAAQTPPPK